MLFRPKPQCSPATIVVLLTGERMLIKERRWGRPKDEKTKQWLYDGTLLEISCSTGIRVAGGISGVPERRINCVLAV